MRYLISVLFSIGNRAISKHTLVVFFNMANFTVSFLIDTKQKSRLPNEKLHR